MISTSQIAKGDVVRVRTNTAEFQGEVVAKDSSGLTLFFYVSPDNCRGTAPWGSRQQPGKDGRPKMEPGRVQIDWRQVQDYVVLH